MTRLRFDVRGVFALVLLVVLLLPRPAGAFSVLSHEEVVDMVWVPEIVPMLRARYPGITDDAIRHAHAYAYGGSVIQDIGYYPFGSHYFSDLLHYVRTGDFVGVLIRDSETPDEYAFALGALAHYAADEIGHPYVNRVTAMENPKLKRRFGQTVTYEQDQTAHVRTEFGFDVVGVAKGVYSQQNYRDFIGFQVAKPLLERAFHETYGIEMSAVIKHEDLAIGSYRFSVSHLIPTMSKVALQSYRKDIETAHPGFDRDKFLYRFNRTEFKQDFGGEYQRPGFLTRFFGAVIACLPKVGPLKALKVTVPNGDEQALYLKSVNETVDRYKGYLAQVTAVPTALPAVAVAEVAPDVAVKAQAKEAVSAKSRGSKGADATGKKNEKSDPIEQADLAAQKAVGLAVKDAGKEVEKAVAGAPESVAKPVVALARTDREAAAGALAVAPEEVRPTMPRLADLDLDTGKTTAEGEYGLSDQTHAKLLANITHGKDVLVPPTLRQDLLRYYAKDGSAVDELKKKPAAWRKVEADLRVFRTEPAPIPAGAPAAVQAPSAGK